MTATRDCQPLEERVLPTNGRPLCGRSTLASIYTSLGDVLDFFEEPNKAMVHIADIIRVPKFDAARVFVISRIMALIYRAGQYHRNSYVATQLSKTGFLTTAVREDLAIIGA